MEPTSLGLPPHDAPAVKDSGINRTSLCSPQAGRLTMVYDAANTQALKLLSRRAARTAGTSDGTESNGQKQIGACLAAFPELLAQRLWQDRGSLFGSEAFQRGIRLRGMDSSPAFLARSKTTAALSTVSAHSSSGSSGEKAIEPRGGTAKSQGSPGSLQPARLVEYFRFQTPRQARFQLLAIEAAA
jgi:hypothetical protein